MVVGGIVLRVVGHKRLGRLQVRAVPAHAEFFIPQADHSLFEVCIVASVRNPQSFPPVPEVDDLVTGQVLLARRALQGGLGRHFLVLQQISSFASLIPM